MSERVVTSNSALYKALSKPFKSKDEFGDATERFFRIVSAAREACGLPEVVVICAARCKDQPPEAPGGPSGLVLRMANHGDPQRVPEMLASGLASYGARVGVMSAADYEAAMRARGGSPPAAKAEPAPGEPTNEEAAPAAGDGQ